MTFADIDAAFAEFARKVVHPDQITDSLLDAVPGSGRFIVIGAERNGRRIIRRAAERGAFVAAFDDFSDPRDPALLDDERRAAWGDRVRIIREPAELAPLLRGRFEGAPWIIAPADGPALAAAERVADLAAPATLLRWGARRDLIGGANLASIRAALDRPRALAG